MKKNTLTKKLTAGLLTGVMVLSMGTTAFAEPTDPAGTGEGDGRGRLSVFIRKLH